MTYPWQNKSFKKYSNVERATIERLVRQIDNLSEQFRKQFLDTITAMAQQLDIPRITRLLEQHRTSEAFEYVNSTAIRNGLRPLADNATSLGIRAGQISAAAIPTELAVSFSVTNPQTINYLRQYELNLIRNLTIAARDAVRIYLVEGMNRGLNPLTIARDVKQVIGLTPRQAQAVLNYRTELERGSAAALQRALRDRRFDATVRAALGGNNLSEAQIDRMVGRYAARMLQYRAQTIARTEATRAHNFGNTQAWIQAADEGAIDPDLVTREWVYTHDSKTRDWHRNIPDLNPDGVGLYEPFKSDLGDIMYPGDPDAEAANTINCRCATFISYKTKRR